MAELKRPEDYPLMLKVKDVMEIMRCAKNQAYDIVNKQDCPKVMVGRVIRIPRDAFFAYIGVEKKAASQAG